MKRTMEATARIQWSKNHGHDTYGHNSDLECDLDIVRDGGVRGKPEENRSVERVLQLCTNARATKTALFWKCFAW